MADENKSPQQQRPNFAIKKTFPLGFLGKDWKDCYLSFYSTSMKENDELSRLKVESKTTAEQNDLVMQFIKDHYIDGVGYDNNSKSVIPIKKEDIELLPSHIQEKIVLFLVGDVNP